MRPHANWPRRLHARRPEVRIALGVSVSLLLAACAGTETRVETAGTVPLPAGAPIRPPEPAPDAPSALLQALETRAVHGLESSGFRMTGNVGGPTPGLQLQLGFSARPERSGAHVPGDAGARWAARPQRRGFLQPSRLIYTVDLRLIDRGSGAETARARAIARQPRGEAEEILGRLTDMAVAALAEGR
jgi:hypothetical protein